MGWRGLVAVVVLLTVGIVGGVGLAAYVAPDPITTGAPTPVTAESPSIPAEPSVPLQDDPTDPPLPRGLEMVDVTVGSGANAFTFPAPVGWTRDESSSNEVVYTPPGTSENAFELRVEQVESQDQTIPDIVAARLAELERDEEAISHTQTYDSLSYDYVRDGYRRFGITYWLDLSRSGTAEAEIEVTGRQVDLPGMEELITRVIRGIRDE